MKLALILASLWVLAATMVATLPKQRQYRPGAMLLTTAPVVIGVIWWQHGMLLGVIALIGFVSMFRSPLRYYYRRLSGKTLKPNEKEEQE